MATKAPKFTAEELKDLAKELGDFVVHLRSRRAQQTETWIRNYSVWRGTHTRSFFHSDTFAHFVPAGRRASERFIIRGAQMLVPSPEFFEAYPADELSDAAGKGAESVRAFLLYVLRKRIKAYSLARVLLRCYTIFNRAILKTGVKLEQTDSGTQVWPNARAVDPFTFFPWPETISDIDDAQRLVEDNMMPWETYSTLMDRKIVEQIKQADLTAPVWPSHIVSRLSASGIPTPVASSSSSAHPQEEGTGAKPKPPEAFLFISEVWMKKGSSWWFVWVLHNVNDGPRIVRVSKRYFKRSSYRMSVAREIPGEQYTTAMMDDIEPTQVLLNDQVNMTLEGQAIAFSPPTVVDPDLVSRADSLVFRPKAKWLAKIDGIKPLVFPDTSSAGFRGVQFSLGLIDSFSGSSPLAEGQPTRNLPRAGFAVSSLLNLSMADIRDAAQMIENDILTPMLGDLYQITVDLVPRTQIFKIPGTQNFPARRMSVEQIEGDWDFVWVGSLQAQDFQVRAQRLVSLLGVISKLGPALLEDLQRQGKRLNLAAILKRLWRDGLGERGADSIIEDMSPQERLQLMMEKAAATAQASQARPGPGSIVTPVPPAGQSDLERAMAAAMTGNEGA